MVFVPFTLIPDGAFRLLAVAGSWASAYWIVRRSALPLYWLVFPPLVTGAMLANPGVLAVALVLGRGAPLGPLIKSFMAAPLLGERRWVSLTAAGLVGLASVAVAPELWSRYQTQVAYVGERLVEDLHYSGTLYVAPWLLPIGMAGILSLLRIDPRTAWWLLIPALWPPMEYHYGIFAMPVAPALGIVLAIGSPPLTTASIGVYGLGRWALAWAAHIGRETRGSGPVSTSGRTS
jgi:hypothetical protein